jgi:hypothetical protein
MPAGAPRLPGTRLARTVPHSLNQMSKEAEEAWQSGSGLS